MASRRVIDFRTVRSTCSECNLSELCLPRGLHPEELKKLEKVIGRAQPLRRGESLFCAGDPLEYIYAVRSGTIKLYQDTDDGEERILGFYLPGELLGLDGIHDNRHHCSAIAMETSSLCAFHYQHLEEACDQLPGLHQQMCRLMSREIAAENQLLLMLKNKTAEERVAGFLLNLSLRHQRLGYSPTEFKLPMSREEIGNYLGLTTETVSRVISKMQRDDILNTRPHIVHIKNKARLHSLCGEWKSAANQQTSAF